jgi:MFS family permease
VTSSEQEAPSGYLELVRTNPHFRRLWIAEIVSLLGDWFNTIALYHLVATLTGSPLALGAVFIFKMLPLGLASPVAGLIVDRFNRRRLMIGSDLVRAALVLGFLLVRDASGVPLLYLLIGLQTVAGAVFQPARSASLPNVTSPRELLTANALSAATWSTMLAIGAALGGVATEWLGTDAVFLIDSGTYLVSALFVLRTVVPQRTERPEAVRGAAALVATAAAKIVDGWRYLRHHPASGRIAFTKAAWSLGGGGMVYMLTLLGGEVSPAAPATAIGVLFAVRGLGTGIGPILGRNLFPHSRAWPAVIGADILVSGLAYAALGGLPFGWIVLLPVLVAHSGSGANWVFANVLLQQRTADEFRGRVFATEWLLIMLADSLSILAAATLLESGVLTLRGAFFTFAFVQVATAAVWFATVVPAERRAGAG